MKNVIHFKLNHIFFQNVIAHELIYIFLKIPNQLKFNKYIHLNSGIFHNRSNSQYVRNRAFLINENNSYYADDKIK